DDPLKLNVRCRGYHGYELQSYFEAHHIYVELADDFQVLMVLPLWHEGDQFPFDELLSRIEKVQLVERQDRKSTRLNSSHVSISYAVFCLTKKRGMRITV